MTIADRFAAHLFNRPVLVLPEFASTIASGRFGFTPRASALAERGSPGGAAPYSISAGVAFLPVHGELVNRGSYLSAASGLTSYDAIQSALRHAEENPQVRAILLDIDSPGGEASGAMETAEIVRSVSSAKRVVAYVNSVAASAAYAIASGAEKIIVTPSATVGSIGVVWLHLDQSKMLADAGIKPTLLFAGAHKVDGNALAPLDPVARKRIQAQIDDVYGLFTDTVGRLRPRLGIAGARATNAGVYIGQKAVDAKLAAAVGSIDTALALLSNPQPKPESRMSTFTSSAAPTAATPAHPSEAESDLAWAEIAAKLGAPPARTSLDQTTGARRHQSQAEIDATWAGIVAELNATLPAGYRLGKQAK